MSSYADRLKALREQLKAEKLDGFVVPLTDEHMSEYVGSYAQRLAWLTGFQGSAGSAVVLPEEAAIFVDGRYTLQVRQQVSADRVELSVGARDQHHRLAQGACARGRSDRLRSVAAHPRLGEEGQGSAGQPRRRAGAGRRATRSTRSGPTVPKPRRRISSSSPTNMPASRRPRSAPRSATGSPSSTPTRRCCRRSIRSPGRSTSAGQTSPTRRSRSPMRLVNADGTADLFVAREKIGPDVRQHLGNGVRLHERSEFESALAELKGKTVVVDPERAVAAIFDALEKAGAKILPLRDPTILPKALKNPAEIARPEGGAEARRRGDRALPPLDRPGSAEGRGRRADRVRQARGLPPRRSPELRDLSFDSISGAGPNGAIVHYKSSEKTNRKLETGHALSDRFGRPVCRRHHRHHPHRRRSASRPRRCATASPAC